jgi:predicted nucleotidyltransferase
MPSVSDRDVIEIRAEIRDFRDQDNRVLTAMRSDLTDLTTRVDGVTERLDALTDRTESGFTQVRGALDASAAGQAHIVELLDQLIRRDS